MAVGTDTAPGGLGVPLNGDFEIKQRTAATDIATITGAASQAGDYIVCRNSSGTEAFVVTVGGSIVAAGSYLQLATPAHVKFGTIWTTAPTPLAAGNLWLVQDSTVLQIAIANASADLKYVDVAATIS